MKLATFPCRTWEGKGRHRQGDCRVQRRSQRGGSGRRRMTLSVGKEGTIPVFESRGPPRVTRNDFPFLPLTRLRDGVAKEGGTYHHDRVSIGLRGSGPPGRLTRDRCGSPEGVWVEWVGLRTTRGNYLCRREGVYLRLGRVEVRSRVNQGGLGLMSRVRRERVIGPREN